MDLIINFTPTGMIPTKEMTPHVPIGVNEIVEDVHEALEIVFMHETNALGNRHTGLLSTEIS
jgi:uncharacterized protein (DUF849 family)